MIKTMSNSFLVCIKISIFTTEIGCQIGTSSKLPKVINIKSTSQPQCVVFFSTQESNEQVMGKWSLMCKNKKTQTQYLQELNY